MRRNILPIALFALLNPLSAFGEDRASTPSLQTFKSKPARDAVRRYLDKTSSYESRLKELIDEAKAALDGELRQAMTEAIENGDDLEVKRISTFLTTDPSDTAKRQTSQPKHSNRTPEQLRLDASIGFWTGKFATTDNVLSIRVNADTSVAIIGKSTNNARVRFHDGRLLVMTSDPMELMEHLELIPNGDRLIALGWNRKRGENPLKDKPTVVAVLERVNP